MISLGAMLDSLERRLRRPLDTAPLLCRQTGNLALALPRFAKTNADRGSSSEIHRYILKYVKRG